MRDEYEIAQDADAPRSGGVGAALGGGTAILSLVRPPTSDAVIQEEMLAEMERATDQVRSGDVAAVIMIKIRADNTFAISNHGNIKRTHAMGFLSQAIHDLAAAE